MGSRTVLVLLCTAFSVAMGTRVTWRMPSPGTALPVPWMLLRWRQQQQLLLRRTNGLPAPPLPRWQQQAMWVGKGATVLSRQCRKNSSSSSSSSSSRRACRR